MVKKEPRTADRLCGAGDAITIKYMIIIAYPPKKSRGDFMDQSYRSYWGVLPGEIVHANNLTIAAKYLYVILSSMAHKNGFCWPENEILASEMQLSKRRVVELLGMLRDSGFIKIVFKQEGKEERRYIYCGMFPDRVDTAPEGCEIPQGGGAEDSTPPCEKPHPPMREIRFPIEVEKQIEKQNENTPKAPKGARRKSQFDLEEDAKPVLRAYCGQDQELTQALADLIDVRTKRKAINSKRAIVCLLKELDRLSGGNRGDKLLLIRQSVTNSWKSVFPLKGRGTPPPAAGEGSGACGWR